MITVGKDPYAFDDERPRPRAARRPRMGSISRALALTLQEPAPTNVPEAHLPHLRSTDDVIRGMTVDVIGREDENLARRFAPIAGRWMTARGAVSDARFVAYALLIRNQALDFASRHMQPKAPKDDGPGAPTVILGGVAAVWLLKRIFQGSE